MRQLIRGGACALAMVAAGCGGTQPAEDPGDRVRTGLTPAAYTEDAPPTYSIEERMERWGVPGASLVVIDDGEIAYAGAFGVKRMGDTAAVTTSTVFQAASVSKPVAAVAALAITEAHSISLDADVNDLLEDWTLPADGVDGTVTIRAILSHSAGLGVGGFAGYPSDDDLPSAVQILDGEPPANSPAVRRVAEPGARFSYSGGGYQVMQQALENATDTPFPDLVDAHLFTPLDMEHSSYAPLSPERKEHAAWGHDPDAPIAEHGPVHPESAAGGLWTTPTDLGLLLIDLMTACDGGSGVVLDSAEVRDLLDPVFWDYGLGFKVMGEGDDFRFSHGGATRGWHSHILAFPERGEGVVVMTNGTNGWVLWPEIERSVAAVLDWPIPRPDAVQPVRLARERLDGYAGRYEMPGLQIRIERDSSSLRLEGGGLTWTLIPTAVDTFAIQDMEGEVYFQREGERPGEPDVTGLHMWFAEPDWSPYREWDFERVR